MSDNNNTRKVMTFASFELYLMANGKLNVDRLVFPADKLKDLIDKELPDAEWTEDLVEVLKIISEKLYEVDYILNEKYGLEMFFTKDGSE